MKPLGRLLIPALTLLVAVSSLNAKDVVSEVTPHETGTVSADRVNVRARASLIGERVAHLRKGDRVTVLAKVTVAPPRKGEPANWLKITMPAAAGVGSPSKRPTNRPEDTLKRAKRRLAQAVYTKANTQPAQRKSVNPPA